MVIQSSTQKCVRCQQQQSTREKKKKKKSLKENAGPHQSLYIMVPLQGRCSHRRRLGFACCAAYHLHDRNSLYDRSRSLVLMDVSHPDMLFYISRGSSSNGRGTHEEQKKKKKFSDGSESQNLFFFFLDVHFQ